MAPSYLLVEHIKHTASHSNHLYDLVCRQNVCVCVRACACVLSIKYGRILNRHHFIRYIILLYIYQPTKTIAIDKNWYIENYRTEDIYRLTVKKKCCQYLNLSMVIIIFFGGRSFRLAGNLKTVQHTKYKKKCYTICRLILTNHKRLINS